LTAGCVAFDIIAIQRKVAIIVDAASNGARAALDR
jgi:hypothetical protein